MAIHAVEHMIYNKIACEKRQLDSNKLHMITIGTPSIKVSEGYAILENTITIDGETKTVWFKVDEKYAKYLCHERDDAYLIACLNYAMRNKHDIVCKQVISEDLLYNINKFLIPALIENNPDFYRVSIDAEVTNEVLPNAGAVGTGISCGVDSLHAIASNTNSNYTAHNITHLSFNNVGSHGFGEEARALFLSRVDRPKQFAKEYDFKFVQSDSNLMDVIDQDHFKTHTYSSMFPVFCLQKLYSVYLYASSGYRFNEFNLKDSPSRSCGSYELLSLSCFSTSNITIISDGMGKTRMEKLKKIVNFTPSYKYLNVCLKEGDNCSKCEKCVRTILELDALGELDKYSNVFDIEYYRNNKKWYLQQLVNHKAAGKHDYHEIYPYFKKEISIIMKLRVVPYKLLCAIKNTIRKNEALYKIAKKLTSN